MHESLNPPNIKSYIEAAEAKPAPLVLAAGSLIWKIVSWWSNIDFVMSIKEDKVASSFQFLADNGWWLVLLACTAWFLWGSRMSARSVLSIGIVTGFLGFIFGALIMAKATGSVPSVIVGWGVLPDKSGCYVTADGSKLADFSDKYYIYVACGILDPTTDHLEDRRMAISNHFNITGSLAMVAKFENKDLIASVNAPNGQIWYEAVLLPKDVDASKISVLSDVIRFGGKIVNAQYWH